MKKLISIILAVILLLSCSVTAFAADESREFFFELTVDGGSEKKVQPGDIITVVFTLHRVDSGENYDMYAMQNEIRYDSEFFRLVEDSAMLTDGISTTEIGLRDNYREFYMNFVSLFGGESWNARKLIGSFQLEVIADSGVTKITNEDYLVSTPDGQDSYLAACQDVTIILTTDCTVSFETNGGSQIPDQFVQYGEKIPRPDNPTREGYSLAGWYTDIDLQDPWDFDTDTVQGNMTLYAKWDQGEAADEIPIDDEGGNLGWLWWLLGLLLLGLLIFLLLLLLNRKTVQFETNCKTKIDAQKVKKGGLVERPAEPSRMGRTFAGWYFDDEYTERWDFENDKVEDDMTLYARWI